MTADFNYGPQPGYFMDELSQTQTSYADSGQMMAVEFDRKIIIYWWMSANLGLLLSVVGIILMPIWIPFGWLVHQKQYEHMSGALTERSLNMRMGWMFKKREYRSGQANRCLIHEGPILSAFGVVRMQFETLAVLFILTGVKNANEFRDLVLRQRDSLVTGPAQQSTPTTESSDV